MLEFSDPMLDPSRADAGPDPVLLGRLHETARLIDRMVREDHHARYFEALKLKRDGLVSDNVTARFFPDLGGVTARTGPAFGAI